MEIVRLYVSHNNASWHEDIPCGKHLDRLAELEIEGATVYHASLLPPITKKRTRSTGARLKQRLY